MVTLEANLDLGMETLNRKVLDKINMYVLMKIQNFGL